MPEMDKHFPIEEVEKLCGLSAGRLRYWDKIGLVSPSGPLEGKKRHYTFQDIIGLKVVKALLKKGLSIRKIRKVAAQLRELLPHLEKPLLELKIQAEGENIVIRGEHIYLEPSGQLLMDFDLEDTEKEIEFQSPASSDYWFERGMDLDSNPETYHEAIQAYLKAIELDPSNVDAYTNLGNIYYRLGDREGAKEQYLQAISIDGFHREALFNMGNIMTEESRDLEASFFYKMALETDPEFADACFNLAFCLERLKKRKEARNYWTFYLELDKDSTSEWAKIAKEHLEKPLEG
jgi:DNA-binding transcriptional MerR regulator